MTADKRGKTELERFFRGYGSISDVKIVKNFAFVEFEEGRDARDAMSGRVWKSTFLILIV